MRFDSMGSIEGVGLRVVVSRDAGVSFEIIYSGVGKALAWMRRPAARNVEERGGRCLFALDLLRFRCFSHQQDQSRVRQLVSRLPTLCKKQEY